MLLPGAPPPIASGSVATIFLTVTVESESRSSLETSSMATTSPLDRSEFRSPMGSLVKQYGLCPVLSSHLQTLSSFGS